MASLEKVLAELLEEAGGQTLAERPKSKFWSSVFQVQEGPSETKPFSRCT